MRSILQPQLSFTVPMTNNGRFKELQEVDRILDANPQIASLVYEDLVRNINPKKGPKGLAAETVIRIAFAQKSFGFTYDDLEFTLADSPSLRDFCRLDCSQAPSKSAVNRDILKIRPETWEAINSQLANYAIEEKIETLNKSRTDCTCVESNIHAPADSEQLKDSVRVLTRLLGTARDLCSRIQFCNHVRRATRRALKIKYARGKARRLAPYRDLLKVTRKTVGHAERATTVLKTLSSITAESLRIQMEHYIDLAERVISQTHRRVIEDKDVPVEEKVVSIFEPHTDIIRKGGRDTVYGHKICLTTGASGIVLDGRILEGNPADSTLTVDAIKRLQNSYNKTPRQASFDGSFCSGGNLVDVKDLGVKDVVFSKSRGMEVEEMASSKRVYKKLRNFRAGIEATISFLKRSFALDRCTWRGERSFKSYVWSSIVSANLLIMARHFLQ